eukprot:TRINITY_DN1233_c0_g1_i1.p1 TRINITY_DN1233_c0_g1~~TRINITY_DN1233_c0_g1_i1.p1  ORF type:complete len:223 (+),score=129.15 TRINITY_DN1233_c0_g1_i1:241-909(+)
MHPEGYVAIDIIASFNKIKALSADLATVVKALKASQTLEVDSDGKMVRRTAPLPETDTSKARTIYAKPFPPTATIETISEFFSAHGKVLFVKVRKTPAGGPKGSVFVEFETEEEAKKVAESQLQFEGKDLIIKPQNAYFEEKKVEAEARKAKKEGTAKKSEEQPEEEKKERTYTSGLILKAADIGAEDITVHAIKDIFNPFGVVHFVEPREGRHHPLRGHAS